jgi:hypothetical protein
MSMTGNATQYELHHPVNFAALLFGACAAPIFWIGQLTLNYAVTAYGCYPGDHPEAIASSAALRAALYTFDVVAILAAAAGGITAWLCFAKTGSPHTNTEKSTSEGRAHFLAIWGLFSSLWFFAAILFNAIASFTVPPCLG